MCAEHFSSMALPVAEFLALEHGTEYAGGAEDVAKVGDDEQQARLPSPGRCPGILLHCAMQLHVDAHRRESPQV